MVADQSADLSAQPQVALAPDDARLPPSQDTAVSAGVFDGVHRGHQYLVGCLAAQARRTGRLAVVVTFDPHPRRVLQPERPVLTLATCEERAERLRAAGADLVITVRFTPAVAAMSPEAFCDFLVARVRLRELWVGPDFALGRGRVGTVPVLRELGATRGFSVNVIEPYRFEGELVKSSTIRQLLRDGDLEHANRLLGRAYDLAGRVVTGAQRGRGLGFPTANLQMPEDRLLPSFGVYAVWAQLGRDTERRLGVANLGVRPTFGGEQVALEVHLFDFSGDLYGREMRVAFARRLREERRFASVEELRAQIALDVVAAQSALGAATRGAAGAG